MSKLRTCSLVFVFTSADLEHHEFTFQLNQTSLESHGQIDRQTALALVTINLEKALGVGARSRSPERMAGDVVVYKGGSVFDLESKIVGVISAGRGVVDFF